MLASAIFRQSLIAAILATLISLLPRSAKAEPLAGDWNFNPDFTAVGAIFGSVLLVDVGFGVYDLSTANKSHPTKTGFAIAEVAFSIPQVVLGTAGVVALIGNKDTGGALFLGGLTLFPLALTLHGIHVLDARNETSDAIGPQRVESNPPLSAGLDSLQLQPTLVAGRTGTVPGMSLQFHF